MKRKDQRRADAEQRQEQYDSLTTQQKLDRAKARCGHSGREIRRLIAQLNKEAGR